MQQLRQIFGAAASDGDPNPPPQQSSPRPSPAVPALAGEDWQDEPLKENEKVCRTVPHPERHSYVLEVRTIEKPINIDPMGPYYEMTGTTANAPNAQSTHERLVRMKDLPSTRESLTLSKGDFVWYKVSEAAEWVGAEVVPAVIDEWRCQ